MHFFSKRALTHSMQHRLAALNPSNSISLALFASAVARSLAAVVDDNARQLLVGNGSGESALPFALRFEELAKQLMQVSKKRHTESIHDMISISMSVVFSSYPQNLGASDKPDLTSPVFWCL
jgi:hypothetical protein